MSFTRTVGGVLVPAGSMPQARAGVESGSDSLGIYDSSNLGGYGGTIGIGGAGGGYPAGPGGTQVSSWGEMLPDPRWATPYDLDQMIRIDGKVAAVLAALTLPIRSAQFGVNASPGDHGAAAWCTAWLANLPATPMDLVMGQIVGATIYGRALFEIVLAATSDGRLTPTKIAWRPPHNTALHRDLSDNVDGIMQRLPGASQPVWIPLDRSLIYLHSPHIDPRNGQSDLLPAWCVHRLRMAIVNLWSIFLRRTATPWANAQAATSSLAEATALARRVATLRAGGVIGTVPNEKVSLLDGSGRGSENFVEAVTWCDQQISASVLAQFLDLGQGHVGSFALSQDHSDFFAMGREAVASEIAAAVSQMLARICALNFGAAAAAPKFKFGPLAETTNTELIAAFTAVNAAANPNPMVTGAFLQSLVIRVAGALGLDMPSIEAESRQRDAPAAAIASGVAVAARMAQAIGVAA